MACYTLSEHTSVNEGNCQKRLNVNEGYSKKTKKMKVFKKVWQCAKEKNGGWDCVTST